MAEALKKLECDPKCGFSVKSHDESEVIKIALEHAKTHHNMTMTEKEAREMLEDA